MSKRPLRTESGLVFMIFTHGIVVASIRRSLMRQHAVDHGPSIRNEILHFVTLSRFPIGPAQAEVRRP